MTSNASKKGDHPLIARLEAIVLEHLDVADFDVETFANLSGLSRSELYRKIKKHTGKSVTEFVRDIRLHKSLEYLKDEERTASEVAYLVGFSSATYFNKCFKDKFGFTPGEVPFHKEKINELLHPSPESTKNKRKKSSVFTVSILLLAAISISLINWFMSDNIEEGESDLNSNEIISVAVLPILNYTGDQKNDEISYGITHDLHKSLLKLKGIERVSPLRAVLAYRDSLPTLKAVAEKLKVKYIIDGRVMKTGSQLKLYFEVIDVFDDKILSGKEFEFKWEPEGTELLQTKINIEIAKTLGLKENTGEFQKRVTTSSQLAHEYYYKGLLQASQFTRESWENARELFEKAIEEDPEFIDAYYELAGLWFYGGQNWAYTTQDSSWANTKLYYLKILELDPGNEEVAKILWVADFYYGLNAADSKPELEDTNMKEWFENRNDISEKKGRHETTHKSIIEFLKRDPANGPAYALLAINYYFLNQPEKAVETLDVHYPLYNNDINFLKEAAKAWYFLGDYKKMEMATLRYYKKFGEEEYTPWIRWLRTIVADKNNDQAMVEEQLEKLLEDYQERKAGSPAWFIALYYAYKNDVDKTLDWLERSYAARESEMTWLAQEPDLHIVGDQPRYRALLDSMNFPVSARRHVVFKD